MLPEKVYPIGKDDTNLTCNVNTIMYLMTYLINETYIRQGIEFGVEDNYLSKINMKNEFLLKTLMLTNGKKHYASLVTMQEGVIFKEPEVDIKGLAIKKTNTNKNVRQKVTEILEESILKSDSVKVGDIVKGYKKLEQEIYQSLKNGEVKYVSPDSSNSASNYDSPYSIKAFRGVMLWNKLFPELEIFLPSKVYTLDLNIPSFEAVKENIDDPKYLAVFKDLFENNSPLITNKGYISVLSMPREIEKIPDIFIPFIDITSQINKNIKSGLPILESAGGEVLPTSDFEYPTNIMHI